ncbi:unnamed protein product, partial [Effrenium voratum]
HLHRPGEDFDCARPAKRAASFVTSGACTTTLQVGSGAQRQVRLDLLYGTFPCTCTTAPSPEPALRHLQLSLPYVTFTFTSPTQSTTAPFCHHHARGSQKQLTDQWAWFHLFDGKPASYKEYRKRIMLYYLKMSNNNKKKEATINLLTSLSGPAWRQVEHMVNAAAAKDDGFQDAIQQLDKAFQYNDRVEMPQNSQDHPVRRRRQQHRLMHGRLRAADLQHPWRTVATRHMGEYLIRLDEGIEDVQQDLAFDYMTGDMVTDLGNHDIEFYGIHDYLKDTGRSGPMLPEPTYVAEEAIPQLRCLHHELDNDGTTEPVQSVPLTFRSGTSPNPHIGKRLIDEEMPDVIWLAPPCKKWSRTQQINQRNEHQAECLAIDREMEHRTNLKLTRQAYLKQQRAGRQAYVEHPLSSLAWTTPALHDLPGRRAEIHQCAYGAGFWMKDHEWAYIKKPTAILLTEAEFTEHFNLLRQYKAKEPAPMSIGSKVFYWRDTAGTGPKVRWKAPATVVMIENDLTNGKPKCYWIVHSTNLLRAAPEHVRRTFEESVTDLGPHDILQQLRNRGTTSYTDLNKTNKR